MLQSCLYPHYIFFSVCVSCWSPVCSHYLIVSAWVRRTGTALTAIHSAHQRLVTSSYTGSTFSQIVPSVPLKSFFFHLQLVKMKADLKMTSNNSLHWVKFTPIYIVWSVTCCQFCKRSNIFCLL